MVEAMEVTDRGLIWGLPRLTVTRTLVMAVDLVGDTAVDLAADTVQGSAVDTAVDLAADTVVDTVDTVGAVFHGQQALT